MGLVPSHIAVGEQWSGLPGISFPADVVWHVLIFERGHWCGACRRHLAEIDQRFEEIARAGAAVIVIVHEPRQESVDHCFSTVSDQELALGELAGVVGRDEDGRITLRPTTLVMDRTGQIRFVYVGDDSRDRPTVAEIILVLDRLNRHPDSDF